MAYCWTNISKLVGVPVKPSHLYLEIILEGAARLHKDLPWSEEEDGALINLIKQPDQTWLAIGKILKRFPLHTKEHYHVLIANYLKEQGKGVLTHLPTFFSFTAIKQLISLTSSAFFRESIVELIGENERSSLAINRITPISFDPIQIERIRADMIRDFQLNFSENRQGWSKNLDFLLIKLFKKSKQSDIVF